MYGSAAHFYFHVYYANDYVTFSFDWNLITHKEIPYTIKPLLLGKLPYLP